MSDPAFEPATKRSHPEVLDRQTGEWITLADYIGSDDYGSVAQKRVGMKLALAEGQPRYVCPVCEAPMVLRSKPTMDRSVRRFYFDHADQRSACTGSRGLSAAAICALRFGHCKEGAAHKQMKAWLEESLSADPSFTSIKPESHWLDADWPPIRPSKAVSWVATTPISLLWPTPCSACTKTRCGCFA